MPSQLVGVQLKSLAELLQRIYTAVDLSQISCAIVGHVRDAVALERRSPTELADLERRLTLALEDMYLAGLTPGGNDGDYASLTARISAAESYFHDQLESAARLIERDGGGYGGILRAAAPAIAEAAQDIVERSSNDFALEVARDQEGIGAPPSLLFKLDGHIVWSNHSLKSLIDARGIERARLMQAACRFAAPLAAALRRRDVPTRRRDLRTHVDDLGVHFEAEIRRRDGSVGDAILVVGVSEAKRATHLSERETEVARLVAAHGSYKDAARESGVSLDSVRTYVRRIYRKLGVTNRMQLKARLIREGLMESEA